VPFLDGGLADEFFGGRGAEIVLDIGFERRSIALEGQQVIGLVGDDPVSDLDLAAHGVDADQGALELLGLGEMVEQIGDGGDLVGLFRHAQLRRCQPRRGRVGAKRVEKSCFLSLGPWFAFAASSTLRHGFLSDVSNYNVSRFELQTNTGRYAEASRFARTSCPNSFQANQRKFAQCCCTCEQHLRSRLASNSAFAAHPMTGRSLPCRDYLPKARATTLMLHWISGAQIVAAVPSGNVGISLSKVASVFRFFRVIGLKQYPRKSNLVFGYLPLRFASLQ
jgi:hypothetical protein